MSVPAKVVIGTVLGLAAGFGLIWALTTFALYLVEITK